MVFDQFNQFSADGRDSRGPAPASEGLQSSERLKNERFCRWRLGT
jgi:hypothetical protein